MAPPTRRPPLGDATARVNNSQELPAHPKPSTQLPHHEFRRPGQKPGGGLKSKAVSPPTPWVPAESQKQNAVEAQNLTAHQIVARRSKAVAEEVKEAEQKRFPQVSAPTNRRKSHIGPWQLGMTLGEGATARVRKARHRSTGQLAAVKIVQRKDARMGQAGSLAAIDREDAKNSNAAHARRMPFGIEREVAIMKLIDHPHVMKLHDIWEHGNDIYLCLEFVEQGELFDYITTNGKLKEKEAMKIFRQILSAVGYCHSFNICHRDLKPENILLTKDGNIKIADFGMAALTQNDEHWLNTSCGSPHYAAPEIISGSRYIGNKVDIWSMGIILFATLAGSLPFDHPGPTLQPLLALIKRGRFEMRPEFSYLAKDLIHRILRVCPEERPSIDQMWQHSLVRKYDSLDDLNQGKNKAQPSADEFRRPTANPDELDVGILRALRSMWHTLDEEQLKKSLVSPGANDQKRFYNLLVKYKDAELENYQPDFPRSNSDYHHFQPRPLNQVRKLSTCQFNIPAQNGRGPQVSTFTVVGNVGVDRKVSNQKVSKPAEFDPYNVDQYNSTGSRNAQVYGADRRAPGRGLLQVPGTYQSSSVPEPSGTVKDNIRSAARRGFATGTSITSSVRSYGSGAGVVKATIGHKRGVSFSRLQRNSLDTSQHSVLRGAATASTSTGYQAQVTGTHSAVNGSRQPSGRYIRSKKPTEMTAGERSEHIMKRKSTRRSHRISRLWEEDVRRMSNSLGQDCEQAFYPAHDPVKRDVGDTVVGDTASASETNLQPKFVSAQFSTFQPDDTRLESSPRLPRTLQHTSGKAWWNNRPLPRPPVRSPSVEAELAAARAHAQRRKAEVMAGEGEVPVHADRQIHHIDRLLHPPTSSHDPPPDRRIRSAPESRTRKASKVLAPIEESSLDCLVLPVTPPNQTRRSDFDFDGGARRQEPQAFKPGVRIVPESSPSPAKPPAPLNIKKKKKARNHGGHFMSGALGESRHPSRQSSHNSRHASHNSRHAGHNTRHASHKNRHVWQQELPPVDHYYDVDERVEENSNGTVRRTEYFTRITRTPTAEQSGSTRNSGRASSGPAYGQHVSARSSMETLKKKSFGFGSLFKKRVSKNENGPEMEIGNDPNDETMSIGEQTGVVDGKRSKESEPQQSWLARLFRVKPAKKFICCAVSRSRIRIEILTILKAWRRHGVENIIIDREKLSIYGRVGFANSMGAKELSFKIDLYTIVEHNSSGPLSIIVLSQEKGAASTLIRLTDELNRLLQERGMLESDKRKSKMMIKTTMAALATMAAAEV